jgi:predicted enzyme involved in methoxymalonyl-ACP biosynthesis
MAGFLLHSGAAVGEVHYRLCQANLAAVSSLDAWLQTLSLVVAVEELSTLNLPRAVQLLNKTNQMNLQTRRMPEEGSLRPGHKNQVAKSGRFA